jgi:hypothetical protein
MMRALITKTLFVLLMAVVIRQAFASYLKGL